MEHQNRPPQQVRSRVGRLKLFGIMCRSIRLFTAALMTHIKLKLTVVTNQLSNFPPRKHFKGKYVGIFTIQVPCLVNSSSLVCLKTKSNAVESPFA